jgi:tetratricopeptide (TPR) repeat protein
VIREYRKALALNPKLDRAHNQLGIVYFHVDHFQNALEEAKIGVALDPYSGFNKLTLGTIYYHSNNYEKLIEILDEWPDNFALFEFRVSLRAVALINLGREQEAESILLHELKSRPNNPALNSAFAILLAKRGDQADALKAINKVETTQVRANHFHHATYNLGVAYSMLNKKEKSLYWLTWTADNGFPCYSFFKNDPLLKNMQDYPPFTTLLARLKTTKDNFTSVIEEKVE